MEIQRLLGSDIVMAFDECPALPATEEAVAKIWGGNMLRLMREVEAAKTATLTSPHDCGTSARSGPGSATTWAESPSRSRARERSGAHTNGAPDGWARQAGRGTWAGADPAITGTLG